MNRIQNNGIKIYKKKYNQVNDNLQLLHLPVCELY